VTDLAPIAGKLATFIRLLASDKDGEVVATAHAMARVLHGIGADLHDLAERVERGGNGALSEAEMQKIFNAGVEAGREQAQPWHDTGMPEMPAPAAMALFCYQQLARLNAWEREFAANMLAWTRWRPLSAKQHAKLEALYLKLGGRV
jgi:hypothetical protein